MKVDLEHVASCIRVWADDAIPYVDPYLFSATVRWIDAHTVELMGVTSAGTDFVATRHDVCERLYLAGVDTLIWVRKKRGKPDRTVRLDTRTGRRK